MKIAAVLSTKGGPGKSTVTASLGAFCADSGLRTLLIDLDNQPSLSSFYALTHEAPGGAYELIANNETRRDQIISQTCIPNLSLIHSNDPFNQLGTLLLHAADGRLRLKNLISTFEPDFDLVLVDTQGARSIILEMALLGADMAISPITPDMLTAREFHRGMLQLYRDLQPLAALGAVTQPLRLQ
ncbi:ParA family protein [Pseudomonas sp. So3.2b]|uniref:ParA family protein n=1 Tax=Pseudomonas sp. So3.2b TaxID=2864101 RepID=UPI001C68E7EB|nr:ParA family protein [Pseudomonas sp. So3.2b]